MTGIVTFHSGGVSDVLKSLEEHSGLWILTILVAQLEVHKSLLMDKLRLCAPDNIYLHWPA